jgi:hypothetical protein
MKIQNLALSLSFSLLAGLSISCGDDKSSSAGTSATDYTLSGTLSSLSVAGFAPSAVNGYRPQAAKTVTHVMAVNPQTASPDTVLSAIGADGTFSLAVKSKSPYVLVFVDSTKIGEEMIAGIFKASTLDSIAGGTSGGSTALGSLSVGTDGKATGISFDDLVTKLGLDKDAALTLGEVDDLSLRNANPDVDGNGLLDKEEGKSFSMDFHIRSISCKGAATCSSNTGNEVTVADMTNRYYDASGASGFNANYNLASIYVVRPTSYDDTDYVTSSGVSAVMKNGGTFTAYHGTTDVTATAPYAPTSVSGGTFSTSRQHGPDYAYTSTAGAVEMPGSGGTPAKLVFGLAGGKTLTFPNVVTRTEAKLESIGSLAPFIQLVTASGTEGDTTGVITGLKYKWMKKTSATEWTAATSAEVELIVAPDAAYAGFYLGAKTKSFGAKIPTSVASGTIAWSSAGGNLGGITEAELAAATPNTICSAAFSFDDKLGLRNFVGSPTPNSGVTTCH